MLECSENRDYRIQPGIALALAKLRFWVCFGCFVNLDILVGFNLTY